MPIKRPILLYSLLAFLFAITLLYQLRYVPDLIHREQTHIPFFSVDPGTNSVALVTRESASLGIHKGDRVLTINGEPFTGTGQLGHAYAAAQPGVPVVVTIVPKMPRLKTGATSQCRSLGPGGLSRMRRSTW